MDTDSIMIEFGDIGVDNSDFDTYIEIADEIGSIVNDAFPDFVQHAFNCPVERKGAITTGREIVSDRSLFLSKKRYIMHVIDDEGKRVDKLKIMGIEVKKADTPAAVKEMLNKLIDMILYDLPDHQIVSNVKDMKPEYMNYTFREIARPISCKGLKKYQDILDDTGSSKGIPYQVRAAMFYNSLCGNSDKKIVPGDKIGVVYIKHPKSKYIAFPIDINEFPAFMDDLIVDWNVQWDKAYTKLESYMSSVDLDIKSRKETVRKNLFGF